MRTRSVTTTATVSDLIEESKNHASSLARGTPLPPDAAVSVHRVMSQIPLSSLGFDPLTERDPYKASIQGIKLGERQGKNLSYYLGLFEDETVTIGIFALPAGASLPLHNHPGMTVLSRLLFGSMNVTAYDILDSKDGGERLREAPRVGDRCIVQKSRSERLEAPASLSLFPLLGNIHEFVAETPCAILDVLLPPYAPPQQDCTYFRIIGQEEGCTTLEAIPEPANFRVKNIN